MDSISPENLAQWLKSPLRPLVIDARPDGAYSQAEGALPHAIRRDPDSAASWALELELARPIVVYCQHGQEASQGVAKVLRERGFPVRYLMGGFRSLDRERRRGRAKTGKAVLMGDARAPQNRSHRLPLAHPPLHRPRCPLYLRARFRGPEGRRRDEARRPMIFPMSRSPIGGSAARSTPSSKITS